MATFKHSYRYICKLLFTLLLSLYGLTSAIAQEGYNFGTPVDEATVAAFNIRPSIPPDGRGLPEGSGDFEQGFEIYYFNCVACHGTLDEPGIYERLFNTEAFTSDTPDHLMNVGNYWPYATTLYDYIQRAMPFALPGSLSPDEVYSLVAFILVENAIIEPDMVLDAQTLPSIEMPAKAIFMPNPDSFLPKREP